MLLIVFVAAILLGIGALTVGPIFGLDELYPAFFSDNSLIWQFSIVSLVVIGAIYWVSSRRKGEEED